MKVYVKNDDDFGKLSVKQKRKITKAIFLNDDIIEQLRDARKNRDDDFSYSGDELEFNKLVDEINSER